MLCTLELVLFIVKRFDPIIGKPYKSTCYVHVCMYVCMYVYMYVYMYNWRWQHTQGLHRYKTHKESNSL